MAFLKKTLETPGEVDSIYVGDSIKLAQALSSDNLSMLGMDSTGNIILNKIHNDVYKFVKEETSDININSSEDSTIISITADVQLNADNSSYTLYCNISNTADTDAEVTFKVFKSDGTTELFMRSNVVTVYSNSNKKIVIGGVITLSTDYTDSIIIKATSTVPVKITGSWYTTKLVILKSGKVVSRENMQEILQNGNYSFQSSTITGDTTGIVYWKDAVLDVDVSTRTVSIKPYELQYYLFSSGKFFIKKETDTYQFPDVEGMHIIYFDSNATLQHTQVFDPMKFFSGSDSLVTMFYWDYDNKELLLHSIQNEMHGIMPGPTHARLHYADGLKIVSGLKLINFNTSEDGSIDSTAKFGYEEGYIVDEDIYQFVEGNHDNNQIPSIYLLGTKWRNGTQVDGFSVITTGSGRLAYNNFDGENYSLEEVPSGSYVNYHVFTTTSITSGKELFTIPGSKYYTSKSDAIVNQIYEAYSLALNGLEMPEYHAVGSILYKTDDSFTNGIKAVIVSIGGGLDYRDLRNTKIGSGEMTLEDLVIPINLIRKVDADDELNESDMDVHIDTSIGNVKLSIPEIASLNRIDRVWTIRKISQDDNTAYIILKNPIDSQWGVENHAFKMVKKGEVLTIGITEQKKYFAEYSFIPDRVVATPTISTLTPSLDSTTLTLNGSVDDIAAEPYVTCKFRYRAFDSVDWVDVEYGTLTSNGIFTTTSEVDETKDYYVQAYILDSVGTYFYGDVKSTTVNYYTDIEAAISDGLTRYWDMQEESGTDVTAIEKLGVSDDDMLAFNGVTISSDVINTITVYKRDFTSTAYMESAFKIDATSSGTTTTVMVQADIRTTSGDHTLFSTGRNIFSCAADNDDIQVNVNNKIQQWTNCTPTGMINMFFIINIVDEYTKLYIVTPDTVTEKTSTFDIPDDISDYLRIARGTAGDGNHQDTEYLADGSIRSIAIWNKELSENEMKDIAYILDIKGMLLV